MDIQQDEIIIQFYDQKMCRRWTTWSAGDFVNRFFGFLRIGYGYSNPMGYQTSDFRLLWTIPPNPQHPSPP